jgi:UMF1 family MFS transporter
MSKRSFLSHSSSFEADDERSSIVSVDNFGFGTMSRDRSRSNSDASSYGSLPPPRYPGDDTRPTSPKELAGWYAYAFAAEVYVICGQS